MTNSRRTSHGPVVEKHCPTQDGVIRFKFTSVFLTKSINVHLMLKAYRLLLATSFRHGRLQIAGNVIITFVLKTNSVCKGLNLGMEKQFILRE